MPELLSILLQMHLRMRKQVPGSDCSETLLYTITYNKLHLVDAGYCI